ncbi:DCC1-like thiol-disulfide oxidoreductase family protein [Paenibacillus larvae]|uniref:DCC1-like thiol-disulfide oxidoreductase family protein n=1 Tax=Paenibacillus larvae TaxID=1464 RepID=UPI00289A2B2E|nr:DCC1-like thiol-disulfide oxidoreductase family protein [Paenibacillus larvae]
MNKQTVQKKPETCDYSLLLFDGACNLCSSAVQFIIRRDPARRFRFASCSLKRAYEWFGN